ncbi:hypothetical protein F8A87_10375 [Betaproteobacteria bacterium SCN2]|jgi:hypothetical protein|nr:hypothetical protein F8A87_10375 [Betaproteobacteria bacterium SCN2]
MREIRLDQSKLYGFRILPEIATLPADASSHDGAVAAAQCDAAVKLGAKVGGKTTAPVVRLGAKVGGKAGIKNIGASLGAKVGSKIGFKSKA